MVGFFPSAPPSKVRSRSPSLWFSFGATVCWGTFNSSIIQNFMHMMSFFAAIILFIVGEFVGINTEEDDKYKAWFASALVMQLVFLVACQAPINISRMPSMSFLQCWFFVPYEDDTSPDKTSPMISAEEKERNRRLLNACASASFFVECSLASCLVCFGLYQELLPISTCVGIKEISLYPWIIVASTCCVGYVVGAITTIRPLSICKDDSCI
jgi:hypothetical protein